MECVRRTSIAGLLAAAALAAASCGGGGATPAVPGAPSAVAPHPAPTPASEGEGASANTCPIGKGDVDASCSKRSPQLLAAVDGAIDRLVRDRPELFNQQEESVAGSGQYRVLDQEAYVDGVLANLRGAGLCAGRSLDRERIQVKSTNAFSEDFDIGSSSRFIRRGGGAYRQTCTPAAFPIDAPDLIAYVRVSFFSFECNPGVVAPLPAEGKLPLGCDGFVTATPKQRDETDVPVLDPRHRDRVGAPRRPGRGAGRSRLVLLEPFQPDPPHPRARGRLRPVRHRARQAGLPERAHDPVDCGRGPRPGRGPPPRWTTSTAAR